MPRAALRVCLAATLAALVALAAARPHVHEAAPVAHGDAPCGLCQLRTVEPAQDPTPDVAPGAVAASGLVLPPGLPPVSGAPLGAVPGQSPPPAAA